MSTAQIAALRSLANVIAAQDPSYAMSEYERAAISLARGVLDILAERDQLAAIAERAKPLLHAIHHAPGE